MKKFIAMLIGVAASSALTQTASAASLKPIHAFCAKTDCADGAQPWGPPVTDGKGNYYGVTDLGGAKNKGTIYRMTLANGHWSFTRLYSFCTDKNCTDGAEPRGSLVIDTDGNLYGTSELGGDVGNGTMFKFSPSGAGGTFKRLYSFCAKAMCLDSAIAQDLSLSYQGQSSGLAYDGQAPLYGETSGGGTTNHGVVFSFTPNAAQTKWTFKTIYSFCPKANCLDGSTPFTSVTVDGAGNLFGTTAAGGKYNFGTVFKLAPGGTGWTHTVLHSFCAQKTSTCPDGTSPIAAPMLDGAGNIYGTTFNGGSTSFGTVYKLVPNGGAYKLTTLHTFCNDTTGGNCVDGNNPWSGPIFDGQGRLFGTTYFGGDANQGTLYRLAGPSLKSFTRMVSFDGTTASGGLPLAGLMFDASGVFYGNTASGTSNTGGAIYKFTP